MLIFKNGQSMCSFYSILILINWNFLSNEPIKTIILQKIKASVLIENETQNQTFKVIIYLTIILEKIMIKKFVRNIPKQKQYF